MKEAFGEYHEPREPQDGRTPEETAADAERMMRAILGITDKPSKPQKTPASDSGNQ